MLASIRPRKSMSSDVGSTAACHSANFQPGFQGLTLDPWPPPGIWGSVRGRFGKMVRSQAGSTQYTIRIERVSCTCTSLAEVRVKSNACLGGGWLRQRAALVRAYDQRGSGGPDTRAWVRHRLEITWRRPPLLTAIIVSSVTRDVRGRSRTWCLLCIRCVVNYSVSGCGLQTALMS